jgi:hypothetical protein
MTAQIRIYLELAAIAIILGAFTWYTVHERGIGEQKIEAADAKAEAAAKAKAAAETALNLARAAQADAGADHDQKLIDDYRATHPEQPVRLCHPNSSVAGLPKGSTVDGGTASAGAGPAPLREVQDGTPGPDIGPGLDALVQAAGRMATLYSDHQKRELIVP